MKTENYAQHKETLLGILNDLMKVEGISPLFQEMFAKTAKKLQEDQFRISLIGAFQGGKSTTFDAICNGRDISPRGNNIKTSACRINVTNISDESEERATVVWKSDYELALTIFDVIKIFSPDALGANLGKYEEFDPCRSLNLNNAPHKKLLRSTIDHYWDTPRFKDSEGLRDINIIADFILTFFEATKEARKKTEFTLEEVRKIMTFPNKMIERYCNDGISSFTGDDALFAFVKEVNCFIKSKSLGRIGCTFTDCPGLFASDYDTSLAIQTITDSDAVLYLLSGEKQIGMEDKEAMKEIYMIKSSSWSKAEDIEKALSNVFFAVNQRKSDEETAFIDLDITEIRDSGFNRTELPKYNALLFYLASFGQAYLNNELDNTTISTFLDRGKKYGTNIGKIWSTMVGRTLFNLDIFELQPVLNQETIDKLKEISGFEKLLSHIGDFIVDKKAESILITHGAEKIQGGLVCIEERLKEIEDLALKDVQAKAAEYRQALNDFKTFKEKVNKLLDEAFPMRIMKPMVDNAYDRFFHSADRLNKISFGITTRLIDYIGDFSTKKKGMKHLWGKWFSDSLEEKTQKEFKEEMQLFFKDAISRELTPVMTLWINNLMNAEDPKYLEYFVEELNRISEEIDRLWNVSVQSSPLLRTLTINKAPIEPGKLAVEDLNYQGSITREMTSDISKIAVAEAIKEILGTLTIYIIGFVSAYIADVLFTGGIYSILTILAGVATQILIAVGLMAEREITSVDDFKKKELKLYNEIHVQISDAFNDDKTKEKICYENKEKSLIAIPNSIAKCYRDYYMKELSTKEKVLQNQVNAAWEAYSLTKEELKRISKEAKEKREKVIMPLRKRTEVFIEQVKKDL